MSVHSHKGTRMQVHATTENAYTAPNKPTPAPHRSPPGLPQHLLHLGPEAAADDVRIRRQLPPLGGQARADGVEIVPGAARDGAAVIDDLGGRLGLAGLVLFIGVGWVWFGRCWFRRVGRVELWGLCIRSRV
jgi:hypothetical protein